jgi:hypothetical protein
MAIFDKEKLTAHMIEKWGADKPCSNCGEKEYSIGKILELTEYDGEGIYPVIPVTCRNCRSVIFISATTFMPNNETTKKVFMDKHYA